MQITSNSLYKMESLKKMLTYKLFLILVEASHGYQLPVERNKQFCVCASSSLDIPSSFFALLIFS